MSATKRSRVVTWGRVAQAALFTGGVAMLVWLVRSAGPARVRDVIAGAGPWIPVVVLLELCLIACDVSAIHALLGATARKSMSRIAWIRSTTVAYASSIVLPAGRAAGEAARAAVLTPYVGLPRAALASTRLQAASLIGNAVISAVCATCALASPEGGQLLAGALFINALMCLVVGTGLFSLVKSDRLARWLRSKIKRLAKIPEADSAAPKGAPAKAIGLSVLSRVLQGIQYGILVLAVSGSTTPRLAFVAQGIHLIGASIGDAIPNQMGATEGAYDVFEHALGSGFAVSHALSIALVMRVAQLSMAAACSLVATAVRQTRGEGEGETEAEGEEAP